MEYKAAIPLPGAAGPAPQFLRDNDPPRLGEPPRSYGDQLRRDLTFDRLLRLAVITAEFSLIVVAFRLTNIETPSFELVATVALGGFLIHHFLPAPWRQSFFALLSVASLPLVFGWEHGAWLLSLGCLLIAMCHLPVAIWVRVALILLAALVLAADRKQVLPWVSPIPTAVWPILGSMFMFRLIVYLYDLKHASCRFSVGRALSYFFMLPNVCFPLFPVVDYKTLQRSAYNEDPLILYQTGLKWMLRGLVHLALYKFVYFIVVIEPGEVATGSDAARYMIATFLLYLKISGLFHVVVGLLHMYGFGLAETHHLYLFSSSFTDFWRRINIYWKDFIQKTVFNPTYFLLRKWEGDTLAVCIATLVAFGSTWFFHSYQWFWIRGEFPVVWSDLIFWLGLGLVVLVNVLLESRTRKPRSLTKQERTLSKDILVALKIAGTFTTICILWTIWSTPNIRELEIVGRALLNSGPLDLAVMLGVPISIGVMGSLVGRRQREVFGGGTGSNLTAKPFLPQVGVISLVAGAFVILALRPSLLSPLSPALATLVNDVRHRVQFNTADAEKLHRGYYEDLGDVTRFNSELWALYGLGEPPGWTAANQTQTRQRNDSIQWEFIPSTAHVFKGALRTINSLGMRDREYALQPAADTYRIALIGSSHDMGAGVRDNETYENLVEDRLNRELGPIVGRHFEILNFSHGGYISTHKLSVIEKRIFAFHPNVILYVAHSQELDGMFRWLQHLVDNHLLYEFPFIETAMERAGVSAEGSLPDETTLEGKLAPFAEDTFRAVLERFRNQSLSRGIQPAMVLLEIPSDSPFRRQIFDRLLSLGQSAELPVLDLQGSFSSVTDRTSLWIAPWDDHTNEKGHRLLADRLYHLLLSQKLVPTNGSDPAPWSVPAVR